MNIALVPICTCKNNKRIKRYNTSTSSLRDVTDQLWWCHNAVSEKTILGENGKMSDQWFFCEIVCSGHKISWCDLPMIFIRDFITHEKHWQIISHVIKKSLFMVTHALFYISHYPQILTTELYVWHKQTVLRYSPYPWWPYCGNLINTVPSLNFKVNCSISITEHRK